MLPRFYPVLVGNSAINLEDDRIVIQAMLGGKRQYAQFDSCAKLYSYLNCLPLAQRCAFEVIKGLRPHRLYFDIDAKPGFPAQDFFPAFFAACSKLLTDLGHKDSVDNWAIYSSCGPDKVSYHIVAKAWSVSHHKEAREFYRLLQTYLEGEHYSAIDGRVYASTQHFRLYGTSKEGANRYKRLGDNQEFTAQGLEDSLVQRVEGTTRLSFPEALRVTTEYSTGDEVVTADQIAEIYDMLNAYTQVNTSNGPAFQLITAIGTMLKYKRLRPVECPTCKRIHEAENPYVTICPDTGMVCFCCRRDSSLISIGRVDLYLDELYSYFLIDCTCAESDSRKDCGIEPVLPRRPLSNATVVSFTKPKITRPGAPSARSVTKCM